MEGVHTLLNKYQYPFENLVFEGGSNKLLPFCGAVKALEESGVWNQIKRLAGSGSGAVMASLLAVGVSSQQLEQLLQDDLENIIRDGKLSKCCLCCVSSGYNPGRSILKWLGARFKECTGKADLTFADVQKRFNKELCIVATNLTEGGVEYHHVKTTPDLKVADSVRMSLATPVLMEAVKKADKVVPYIESWFVEGGVLCNYPIHAYDGWWLSLEEDQTFLKKLPQADTSTQDRFSTFSNKTLGFITIDEACVNHLPPKLIQQVKDSEIDSKPHDSKLFKNIEKLASDKAKLESKYASYATLANQLIKNLEEHKKSRHDNFTRDDLRIILSKSQLSDEELSLLFGANQADDIFRRFLNTKDNKKEASVQDVYNCLERGRKSVQDHSVHLKASKLNSNVEQLKALSDLLHENSLKSIFISNIKNVERTVVIPTGYIDSRFSGKRLNKQDKQFLVEQGTSATKHFLESFIKRIPLLKEDGEKNSFSREDLKQYIDDDVSEVIDEKDYLESYLEKVL